MQMLSSMISASPDASGGSCAPPPSLHPDTYVPELIKEMQAAVQLFKSTNGSIASLATAADVFKRVTSALNRGAPPQGQHNFRVGQRGILQGLKQLPELNGCTTIVKAAADAIEGDGRVEVYLASANKNETIRVKPTNLRLEKHVFAEAHAAALGHTVRVTSLNSPLRNSLCRVIAFDGATRRVTVREANHEEIAAITSKYVNSPDLRPHGRPPGWQEGDPIVVREFINKLSLEILQHLGMQKYEEIFIKERICDSILGSIDEDTFVKCLEFTRDDAATFTREVRAILAPPPVSEVVSISEIVPSIFVDLAKEAHTLAMKFISTAAGLIATPTVTIVLNAALSAALFSIRSAADAVASRICCTLIKMLHTGGPPSPKQKDKDERHTWTQNFILACTMSVDKELCAANYHQAALNIANQCLQVVEDSIGRENIVYSILHMNTSKHLANLQRWDEAQATYKESVRLMDKTVAAAGSDPLEILPSVADMYKKNVPPEEAEATFLETVRVVELKSGRHCMEAFAPLKGLAVLYEEQNRLEEAEAMLKESIQIKTSICGPDAMDLASLMQTLSSLCIKRNKPAEAEAALKEAVRILELKRGHDSEAVARALNSLGSLYQSHGLFDESETQFKEALRIFEMKLGHASIEVSTTLGLIGNLYKQSNRLDEAEANCAEALNVVQRGLGSDHPEVSTALISLASVTAAMGKHKEAEMMYLTALGIREQRYGRDSLESAYVLNDLASLYQCQGLLAEAETLLSEVLTTSERLLPPNSPIVIQTQNRIAGLGPPPLAEILACDDDGLGPPPLAEILAPDDAS